MQLPIHSTPLVPLIRGIKATFMKITIIIVNWNTGKLLTQCLESLAVLPEKGLISEVTIVDNYSSDDSYIQAKRIDIGVPTSFVRLPKNVGFAAANNIAIRQRRDKGSHVLLLNPDTQVKAGAIAAGLHELEHTERAGVVGIKLINIDGTIQQSVRRLPTLPVFLFFFLKLHRLFPDSSLWHKYMQHAFEYEKKASVEQVMGAAFFINQKLLGQIGLLDEKFWIWFEEVDFCKRTLAAGWQVMYTPAGSVMHYGGSSFNQLVGLQKTVPFLTSSLHYAHKHFPLPAYVCLLILWPIAVLISLPTSFIHARLRYINQDRL